MRTSTNLTSPKINDHVNLQLPISYEQLQESNMKSHGEQTPWVQTLTTRLSTKWLIIS
jgi:hypothetical protein